MKYAVTCGGTGGHVFPGVATAAALKAAGDDAALILSGRGVEGMSAAGWTGEIMAVPCPPLRKHPFAVFKAIAAAFRQLKKYEPDALLAMGSYSSVAPVLAARILRIPVVLHEANAVPGLANRFLSRFASAVAISFPDAGRFFPRGLRIVDTGMPARSGISAPSGEPRDFTSGTAVPVLLVMGGSQGARAVNSLVVSAASVLASRGRRFKIIHLAGRAGEDAVKAAYSAAGADAEVIGFSNEMNRLYSEADICVSRSGAASCFELCLAELPSILIPLPTAARDHQTANAAVLAGCGAAVRVVQNELTPESLADAISALADDTAKRSAMRKALKLLARPDAALSLADLLRKAARGFSSASDV